MSVVDECLAQIVDGAPPAIHLRIGARQWDDVRLDAGGSKGTVKMTEAELQDKEPPEGTGDRPPPDLEPDESDALSVRGGATPAPGGPVPIPYPNVKEV